MSMRDEGAIAMPSEAEMVKDTAEGLQQQEHEHYQPNDGMV